ncbi:hypothetical protein [Thermoactinospora rubra]|uniref:hypothetical protein n=1 Tax=Thermoactinospora rubra TaxID=1088767 RepID=UPI000A1086D7|nr:hypothetical protein [Thermoactinospora rubra]
MSTPMSREGADHALKARRAEQDRISESLLTLEAGTTYRLLDTSPLRGATQRRWAGVRQAAATLWALNDAYRATLRLAEEVRARRARPGAEELAELTDLLAGRSVAVKPPAPATPTLLPPPEVRISLDEVVVRMEAAYREIASELEAVDAVWSAVFPRLDEAEAALRRIAGLAAELGEGPDVTDLQEEVRRLRDDTLCDPLGAAPPADRLDRLLTRVRGLLAGLERALAVKQEYGRRKETLTGLIARVGEAEKQARLAHTQVCAKIALPASARPASRAEELAAELEAIDVSPGGWLERAEGLARLEQAAAEAEGRARQAAGALLGLVNRRDELRGRLLASQAKAVRKKLAEDPAVAGLYDRAHDLLWTAPCDLAEAARAVEQYHRAIGGTR